MTVSSAPNDNITSRPLESTQPTDAVPLANQLSYADFQAVFPTTSMKTAEADSSQVLSFDNSIYAKGEPGVAASQGADAKPSTGTVADSKTSTSTATDSKPATGTEADSKPATSTEADSKPSASTATDSKPATSTAADATPSANTTKAGAENKGDPATYEKDMNKDIKTLSADEKALQTATKDDSSSSNRSDLVQKLDKDEASLHKDFEGFLSSSVSKSNYKDFSATMTADHSDLLSIAKGLDKMGLQPEASKTTAYYPLSHYKHDFSQVGSTGPGGGDGYSIKPPAGSTEDTGLDTASTQFTDTKPGDIGGTGGVTSATITQDGPASAQTVTYSETGGGTYVDKDGQTKNNYSDSLWRSDDNSTAAVNAKQVQLDTTMEMTASQLANTSEIEKDIVVQKADGTHATIGTQINTKNGDVDFYNSQTHHWIDEGSVTGGKALEANTKYTLQLGATVNDDTSNPKDSTYTYDYYTLNGKTLAPSNGSTFNAGISNWKTGVYIQTQVDEGVQPKGTVAGFTESNEQLWIGY